jgi:uncharacterized membrane protein YphA (DoxX/SURF4 family)
MLTNQEKEHKTLQMLRIVYGVVPIVAGLDKFFNFLTDWTRYLNPTFGQLLPVRAATFMHVVGVIEIAAGLIVLSRFSEIGAYIVSAWLTLIALTLIASGNYLDVAVRDLVMSAGAYALGALSYSHQEHTAFSVRNRPSQFAQMP